MKDVHKEVYDWIDEHRRNIVDFCSEFIEHRSITGEELEVQREFLLPFLENEMEWDEVDCFSLSKERERPNINAVLRGEGRGASLLINGHVDVFPVPRNQLPQWTTDPWKPIVRDGMLYGRGSNDMKGGITSALWAVKALMELGIRPRGTVALEAVVGEEAMEHQIGTTGATRRLLERGHEFQFCIDPEPTNCEIHTISPGSFDFEIVIQGKDVHDGERNLVLFPQRWGIPSGGAVGVDALSRMMGLLRLLEKKEREWNHRWRHPILGGGGHPRPDSQGVGCFSLNPGIVEAGTHFSAVPGYARAHFNCYHPAWIKHEDVLAEIGGLIDAYASTDDWLRERPPKLIKPNIVWPPFEVDVERRECQILAETWRNATGREAIFSGFKAVADVSFLQALGIHGVCMGPGDMLMGTHGPDEHVPIDHLIDCAKAFACFMIDLNLGE